MVLDDDTGRADAYRLLADLFFTPPTDDVLAEIKDDLALKSEEDEEEILEDFNLLFSYPGGSLLPVESLYITSVDVPPSLAVAAFYADAGLTLDEEYDVVPDHLSLELLFMSYIVETNKTDLQKRFLEEHIMNWVPAYCDEVSRQAQTVFYKEVAQITKNFIESEFGEL